MLKESGKAIPDSCSEGTLEWVKSDVLFEREMPRSSRECLRHYLDVGKFNDSVYVMVSTGGLEDRRYDICPIDPQRLRIPDACPDRLLRAKTYLNA